MRTTNGPVCEDRPIVDLSLKELEQEPGVHIWKLSVSQWSSAGPYAYDRELLSACLLELHHLEVVEWTWAGARLWLQPSNLAQTLAADSFPKNLTIRWLSDKQLYQDVVRLLSTVLRSIFEVSSDIMYPSIAG